MDTSQAKHALADPTRGRYVMDCDNLTHTLTSIHASLAPTTISQGGYILQQLNWMGMVQIVEIRQRGFSVRYPHNEFVTKYGRIVGRGPGQPDFQGPLEGENQGAAAWREEAERVSRRSTAGGRGCRGVKGGGVKVVGVRWRNGVVDRCFTVSWLFFLHWC